jgi:hypothetical protein
MFGLRTYEIACCVCELTIVLLSRRWACKYSSWQERAGIELCFNTSRGIRKIQFPFLKVARFPVGVCCRSIHCQCSFSLIRTSCFGMSTYFSAILGPGRARSKVGYVHCNRTYEHKTCFHGMVSMHNHINPARRACCDAFKCTATAQRMQSLTCQMSFRHHRHLHHRQHHNKNLPCVPFRHATTTRVN